MFSTKPANSLVLSIIVALFMACGSMAQTTDTIPPLPPTGLTATASTCGQVDLSWGASVDNTGGSGLKAYIINRSDGVNTSIGVGRTIFSDTNYLKSSTTLTYYVVAMDSAGNKSLPSNSVTVSTPPCPISASETVIDGAYIEPLGKAIATYGARTLLIYAKRDPITLTLNTWAYVHDSDTSLTSTFLLHTSPGYHQIETDYLLTGATDLWTLSFDSYAGGKVLVNHYVLNGPPVTAAVLVSTNSLGDSHSYAKSMLRLASGGLIAAWNEDFVLNADSSDTAGFAYRSPTGNWTSQFPVSIPNTEGGNITRSRMVLAQHPADKSIWAFAKRDSFDDIIAVHFTETSGGIIRDWINAAYIDQATDGVNGPETEFPYLAAIADSTRNAILLAYQANQDGIIFVDPLLNSMNNIFLKTATATIAQISANGTRSFIPFPNYLERICQFGFSVLSDGTLWFTYQPVNHTSLTWNQVYASKYSSGSWTTPALVGFNYNNYNNSNGLDWDPGALAYRTDQPEVAFLTPDAMLHTFDVSNLGPAPVDTTPPTTSITSPANGATVSGTVTVSASASDNIGVTQLQLLIDGAVIGTLTASPYNFSWNTTAIANGSHTLQTKAYDAAGNVATSAIVTVTVSNSTLTNLTVAITNPSNGGTVPRNQKVTISASATDSVGISKVQFSVNGSLIGTTTVAPYSCPWKVPGKSHASYKIQAQAYDAAGNTAAQAITVTAQ
jgi:hypothetical protein